MDWMNEIGGLLQRYAGAAAAPAQQESETTTEDFDRVASHAPGPVLSDGLASAFRSDQTPPFEQMVGHLFGQSNSEQRAGILNTLISALGPSLVSQYLAGRGLSGLAGMLNSGQSRISPEQADQVPPETVQDMAARAESENPSIVDRFSDFFAAHPDLVKTLGSAALAILISKVAQKHG